MGITGVERRRDDEKMRRREDETMDDGRRDDVDAETRGHPTHVRAQQFRVLSIVRNDDPRLCSLRQDFLSELTRSPTLDGVELVVDPATLSGKSPG